MLKIGNLSVDAFCFLKWSVTGKWRGFVWVGWLLGKGIAIKSNIQALNMCQGLQFLSALSG